MSQNLENLELFITECDESLEQLESGLLELEQKGPVAEIIDNIFRAAHTIKGSARLMGFGSLEKLSHSMEEILEKVRSNETTLNSNIISLLLKGTDALRSGTYHLAEHQEENACAFEHLLEDLKLCSEGTLTAMGAATKAINVPNEDEQDWDSADDWKDFPVAVSSITNIAPKTQSLELTHSMPAKPSVKIDVDSLDKIMNLVEELVLCRNQLIQLSQSQNNPSLQTTVGAISTITSELQERVMNTRMLQVGTLFNRYHRMVRDLSQNLGKKVNLVIENQDAELDRNMLEQLKDPLSHLINNAMDHGIESPSERKLKGKPQEGKIVLNSYHESGQVVIEVRDDGHGFNVEKIKQRIVEKGLMPEIELLKLSEDEVLQNIFWPGFSTLDTATLISGRGVGLDVVKSNISSIGGQVTVQSKGDHGSVFKLHIPLTLAVIPAITVEVNRHIFAIPQSHLQELICLEKDEFEKIESIEHVETYRLRGKLLPIIRLGDLIGVESTNSEQYFVLVLICGDQRFGLLVDQIRDIEEIVVKPLSPHFKNTQLFMGVTLLGNGDIALILDIISVGAQKNIKPNDSSSVLEATAFRTKTASTALLFHVGATEIFAIQLSQVRRLEEIRKSQIEYSGPREVIQSRGEIMPLIKLHEVMEIDHNETDGDVQNLVVVGYHNKEVAIKVNEIIDSIDFEGELNTAIIDEPCVLGTMMVNDQPYLLLDTIKMIDLAFKPVLKEPHPSVDFKILYVDDSSFFLKVVKKYLEEAGYDAATEISSVKALELVQSGEFDLLLVDLEMPEINGFQFIQKVKENPNLAHISIVVLSSIASKRDKDLALEMGADGYLVKIDKEELLEKVQSFVDKEVLV